MSYFTYRFFLLSCFKVYVSNNSRYLAVAEVPIRLIQSIHHLERIVQLSICTYVPPLCSLHLSAKRCKNCEGMHILINGQRQTVIFLPFEHTMYAKRSLSAPVPRSLTQSTPNLPPHISLSQPLFRGLHQGCVYSLHTSSAPHLSFLPPLPLRLTFCSSDVCMSGCRAAVTPLYMCSLVTCESASTKCCKEMNRNYTILHSLLQSSHCRCHC